MARTLPRMGPPNTIHFGNRPDETSRGVVRPSPDFLYSVCPFDLSKGPLQITARVPHSTYWSVSGFDAATNNFFVRDDQQIAGDSIEIIALRPGMTLPPVDDAPDRVIVIAPTTGVCSCSVWSSMTRGNWPPSTPSAARLRARRSRRYPVRPSFEFEPVAEISRAKANLQRFGTAP